MVAKKKAVPMTRSLGEWIGQVFSIYDFFGFGGLAMVFYGLYEFKPWVAFTVVGAITFLLCVIASLTGGSEEKITRG